MVSNPELSWADFDNKFDSYALDVADKPVKFRITRRMRELDKGTLPFKAQDEENGEVSFITKACLHYIVNRNYRMLFALMNSYGYDSLNLDMILHIPLPDILSIFPQGCFIKHPQNMDNLEHPIDFWIRYSWLYQSIDVLIRYLLEGVKYFEISDYIDFILIMQDLKKDPLNLIKGILKSREYREVIMKNCESSYKNSEFPNKDSINDTILIINEVDGIFYRISFLPWSLSTTSFFNSADYDNRLNPFRDGLFDFGPIPLWSKATHSKYPLEVKDQVKTLLLIKNRKGNIVNRLFHKDLLVLLFQYMAFNSLMIEKQYAIDYYNLKLGHHNKK